MIVSRNSWGRGLGELRLRQPKQLGTGFGGPEATSAETAGDGSAVSLCET